MTLSINVTQMYEAAVYTLVNGGIQGLTHQKICCFWCVSSPICREAHHDGFTRNL